MSPLKFETIRRFFGFRFEDFSEIRLYESKLYELKLYEMQLYESKLYEMLLSPKTISLRFVFTNSINKHLLLKFSLHTS